WRQVEVLQEPRVQLINGLDGTKETPTSVPTTREQSRCPAFHPLQVGKAGGKLTWQRLGQQKECGAATALALDTPGLPTCARMPNVHAMPRTADITDDRCCARHDGADRRSALNSWQHDQDAPAFYSVERHRHRCGCCRIKASTAFLRFPVARF